MLVSTISEIVYATSILNLLATSEVLEIFFVKSESPALRARVM